MVYATDGYFNPTLYTLSLDGKGMLQDISRHSLLSEMAMDIGPVYIIAHDPRDVIAHGNIYANDSSGPWPSGGFVVPIRALPEEVLKVGEDIWEV